MNIVNTNEVVLEFLKLKKNKQETKIVEVIRISPNGNRIIIYQPNSGKGCPVSDIPPPPPTDVGHYLEFNYNNLPQKYWKKYLYASR
jgi:polo-like kinase 4